MGLIQELVLRARFLTRKEEGLFLATDARLFPEAGSGVQDVDRMEQVLCWPGRLMFLSADWVTFRIPWG
ncbi:MAG: hypothetical protein KGL58_04690 [Pseudomonadota bacterium]|nr:hypothetical protein [Pseudomonadota bacterium]